MLVPSIGIWATPAASAGASRPMASNSVGVMSLTWWYWGRTAPVLANPAGQEMMSGSRTPPAWVFCLYHLSGVLPTMAHPIG